MIAVVCVPKGPAMTSQNGIAVRITDSRKPVR